MDLKEAVLKAKPSAKWTDVSFGLLDFYTLYIDGLFVLYSFKTGNIKTYNIKTYNIKTYNIKTYSIKIYRIKT